MAIFFLKSVKVMSLIHSNHSSSSECFSGVEPRICMIYIELYKKRRTILSFSLTTLISYLFLLHSIIVLYLLYVFIFYLDIIFFPATEKYRMSTAQKKGCEATIRKPARAPPASSQALPLGLGCPHVSASPWASASLLSFCGLPFSALSAERKRQLRSGEQLRMTRGSEVPGGKLFVLLESGRCGCSPDLREGDLCSLTSLVSASWM